MMKKLILTLLCCMAVVTASAQVGYQVSLLNTATGEPRANESVSVIVKITDSAGNVVCEETKQETTNDFGVLSMTVGSQSTFKDADWSKLPFFIEATIDNRLIGRSQILSVPVAEHAKHSGQLTQQLLCSKSWKYKDADKDYYYVCTYEFNSDNTYTRKVTDDEGTYIHKGTYYMQNNQVFGTIGSQYSNRMPNNLVYIEEKGVLMDYEGHHCHE